MVYGISVGDKVQRCIDVFYPLELVEQIKVNNAQENEEIKQENKRLQNEKNDLLKKVGKSLYEIILIFSEQFQTGSFCRILPTLDHHV